MVSIRSVCQTVGRLVSALLAVLILATFLSLPASASYTGTEDGTPIYETVSEQPEEQQVPEEAVFADVPSGHWAFECIQRAYADGVTNGTGISADGERYFAPESPVTFAEAETILARAFSSEHIEKRAEDRRQVAGARAVESIAGLTFPDMAPDTYLTAKTAYALLQRRCCASGTDFPLTAKAIYPAENPATRAQFLQWVYAVKDAVGDANPFDMEQASVQKPLYGWNIIRREHSPYADIGASSSPVCNPCYGNAGYDTNCANCVVAYEMRRRGYDVVANWGLGTSDTAWQSFFRGGTVESIYIDECKSVQDEVAAFISEHYPDGARGALRVIWQNEPCAGHLFSWEISEGKVLFMDPQNGIRNASYYFIDVNRSCNVLCMRWDDLELSYAGLGACRNRF